MLLSKQINALNYIQIHSQLVEPDHLFPIIISSLSPSTEMKDETVSSCDSMEFKTPVQINPAEKNHESDDETQIEEEPITKTVVEVISPPVPKKSVQKDISQNIAHQKRKKNGFMYNFRRKKKKDNDCMIM